MENSNESIIIEYKLKYLPSDNGKNDIINELAKTFMEDLVLEIKQQINEVTFLKLKLEGDVFLPINDKDISNKDVIKNIKITKNAVIGGVSDDFRKIFYHHIGLLA